MDPNALGLTKYLDLLPQPAMIFTSEADSDALTVCYVNKNFLDSVGDSPLEEDSEALIIGHNDPLDRAPRDYMKILQKQCISPTAAKFTEWINGVAYQPEKMHHLKTRFNGYSLPQGSNISERIPKVVLIEWNAAVMEGRFIVLTGRRTGTVKYSPTSPPSMEQVIQRDFEFAPTIREETEEDSQTSEEPQSYSEAIATSSSSSNESNRHRHGRRRHRNSTNPSSDRTRVGSGSENGNPLGNHIDTWKLTEKVLGHSIELMEVCQDDCWRRPKWKTIEGERLVEDTSRTYTFLESDPSDDDVYLDG